MKCANPQCRRSVSLVTVCAPCRRAGLRASPPPVKTTGYIGEPETLTGGTPAWQHMTDQQIERYHRALVIMVIVSGLLAGLTLLASAPTMTSFN